MSLKQICVADLGEIITGHTPPTKNREYYGTYALFIKPTDIALDSKYTYVTEEYYSEKAYEKYKNSLIPKGATCVVTLGSVGKKITKAHCDCFTNQSMNAVIPNENIDEEYLFYLLKNNLHLLVVHNNGTASGRDHVSKTTFSKIILFAEMNIEKQRKIGKILATYDDLIENNQKQIMLLEEAASRLYKEWFVKLRFPGYETTNIIDGVPEEWARSKVGEICQTIGGGTPSTKVASYYENGNILWVTPTDITHNESIILLDTEKKITESGLKNSSAKMLSPDTILMTSRASIGFFALIDKEVCTNQGFISCIPNKEIMRMYLLFNLIMRREEILQKAGGTTYREINKATFRDMEIIVPNDNLLKEYNSITYKYILKIRNCMKVIANLRQARDKLLPKLMSGEIEV
ncbi:MAG: EcoKI restriction-modification system protein HsdS [Pelotomaculum sp. PtaB.Bin104]|nr:MAG: EcoKI restriction-modification system protein HsdS [Pelotomaculum sp. PtaB.Bin104]